MKAHEKLLVWPSEFMRGSWSMKEPGSWSWWRAVEETSERTGNTRGSRSDRLGQLDCTNFVRAPGGIEVEEGEDKTRQTTTDSLHLYVSSIYSKLNVHQERGGREEKGARRPAILCGWMGGPSSPVVSEAFEASRKRRINDIRDS